jgi:serine/threonine protein kinase
VVCLATGLTVSRLRHCCSCFVTEFLERGDLFGVLRNLDNKLTWAEPILRMTIDTSRGMAYLHSMKPPIIHRDLKSMNILVR